MNDKKLDEYEDGDVRMNGVIKPRWKDMLKLFRQHRLAIIEVHRPEDNGDVKREWKCKRCEDEIFAFPNPRTFENAAVVGADEVVD